MDDTAAPVIETRKKKRDKKKGISTRVKKSRTKSRNRGRATSLLHTKSTGSLEGPESLALKNVLMRLHLHVSYSETLKSTKAGTEANQTNSGTKVSGKEIVDFLANSSYVKKTIPDITPDDLINSGLLRPEKPSMLPFSPKHTYVIAFPWVIDDVSIRSIFMPFPEVKQSLIIGSREGSPILFKRALKCESHLIAEAEHISQIDLPEVPSLLGLFQSETSMILEQTWPYPDAAPICLRIQEYPITESIALRIIFKLAQTLSKYHEKGLVHGHLNLLSVYVAGAGPITDESAFILLNTSSFIDTTNGKFSCVVSLFTAPELVGPSTDVATSADMWSLGICLYWLLFGAPPYLTEDLCHLPKVVNGLPNFSSKTGYSISPLAKLILLQLLNVDPSRRPTAEGLLMFNNDEGISDLNTTLTHSYPVWHSFLHMRKTKKISVLDKRFLTFRTITRPKKSIAHHGTVHIGIAAISLKETKKIISSVAENALETTSLQSVILSTDVSTRLYPIDAENLSVWKPEYTRISHVYYFVDYGCVESSQLEQQLGLDRVMVLLQKLYVANQFYCKLRSEMYNCPITIITHNTTALKAIWTNIKDSFSFDTVEQYMDTVEKRFKTLKHKTPIPRLMTIIRRDDLDKNELSTLFTQNSVDFSYRCEPRDTDECIKSTVQLKLANCSLAFPFANSKTKISKLPVLAEFLRDVKSSITSLCLSNIFTKGKEASDFFAEALPSNTSITSLDISCNPIGDSGIASLIRVLRKNESITSLILSDVQMTEVGATNLATGLATLSSLSLLDLSYNNIKDIGSIAIGKSLLTNKSVRSLYVQECGFLEAGTFIFCELLRIGCLGHLDLSGNIIPQYILPNMLQYLKASMNRGPLKIILPKFSTYKPLRDYLKQRNSSYKHHVAHQKKPESLGELKQLNSEELDLSFCALSTFTMLPCWNSSEITYLNLSNNCLSVFPDAIKQCVNVRRLSLAQNKLKSTGCLVSLKCLEELNLSFNAFKKVSCIEHLFRLQKIDLRYNQLRALPVITELFFLKELLVDHNALLKISFPVLKVPLCNFTTSKNLIISAKTEIYSAWSTDLRILDLSHFQLNVIPKEISLLEYLVELNVSHNRIQTIPTQMRQLKQLRTFNVSSNELENIDALEPLTSIDVMLLSLMANPNLPSHLLSAPVSSAVIKDLLKEEKEKKILLHRAKLMIVGPSGVGKTVVSQMLRTGQKQRKKQGAALRSSKFSNASDGIKIQEWVADEKSNPPVTLSVWDMAGSNVYRTIHAFFLEERSLFLVMFNVSLPESKQNILYWLQMISTSAPESPILLVGTHAELLDPEDITFVGNQMIEKYSSKFNITNFISICSFEACDIETLQNSILTVFRSQKYIQEEVPAGYRQLIRSIEGERSLCSPPFVSLEEFEQMVIFCGIESSAQTVAEYLTLLGIVSFFNDKKIGVSSSVMLDPSWLISLMTTVVSARENGIEKGILYHNHFPKIWGGYPPSLHPYLIQLFNAIELLFTSKEPHPEFGAYSLIPSTFSTSRVGAQSQFISIDDYMALGLGTQMERIYTFDFLPFGFFSRLIVRLLHFTTPTFYWNLGIVCTSGENTGLVEFESMGGQKGELSVKIRGKNPVKLLRGIVENIDLLLSGWYKSKTSVVVPFIMKGRKPLVGVDYQFSLEDLEQAAAFGQTTCDFDEKGTVIPVPIKSIAPDLVMADISEILMKWDELTIEKQVGQGAFGKVYAAIFKGQKVAVKLIEVEKNMKTEAYGEFRREVALCSELNHPTIVALCGVCLDPWGLALEYMPHGDLYTFINNHDNEMTWKMRIKMIQNIAEAIRFLHSFQPKIIHRDLKSPNCLMASVDPEAEYLVKVTDFGESRAVATSYTGRDRLHNPVWLAPEIMKKEQYTEKADVFSFGIIMWELIGRAPPFDEYEIAQSSFTYQLEDAIIGGLRPSIPVGMKCLPAYIQLMEDCWNGDPKGRPQFADICKRIYRMQQPNLGNSRP